MTSEMQMTAFQERLNSLDREIGQLSVSDKSRQEYFRLFLEQMVAVLGVGGAVWAISDIGVVESLCHINLTTAGLEENGSQAQLLSRALQNVHETGGAVVLPSQGGSDIFDGGLGKDGINDSQHTLLFVPIAASEKIAAILLLISPAEVDPRAVRGYLGFVEGLCERAGIFLQREMIRELEAQIARGDRLRQFVSALHSGLNPKRSCYALANYAQELLGVYRCMAGTFSSSGRFRMESVSGVESVAIKSSFIKSISEIAREVCRNDKVLLVDNPNAAVKADCAESDDLLTAARLYMLQAQSLVLGVFPIKLEERVVGALVVEKASEQAIDPSQRRQIEGLLAEAGSALSNGMTYRNLPFSPFVRALGGLRDKVYVMAGLRRAVLAAVLLIAGTAPFLLKGQIKAIGTAELVPIEARIAYAGQEGVIEVVSVETGQKVQKGEVLASLDKREIESEIDRVTEALGEASLAYRQALDGGMTTMARQYEHRLAALEAERNKYVLHQGQYEIKAPITGRVITRQSSIKQLLSKPVMRGEPILEIVPDESPWQLLVNIAENEVGELLKAYDQLEDGKSLEAKIILNAYPNKTFRTKVISVARQAYVLSTGEQKYRNVIEVRVEGPTELKENIEPRDGMKGKVAIECGRRSLFYVVTHDFVDFVRVSMF